MFLLGNVSLPGGENPEPKVKEHHHNIKIEDNGIGSFTDDELLTLLTFERPDGLPVTELYNTGPGGPTSDQEDELEDTSGCLEAIFRQGGLAFAHPGTTCNTWELNSCIWSNMPGALQVPELPSECTTFNSTSSSD